MSLNIVADVGKMKVDEVVCGVMPSMLAECAVMVLFVLFSSIVLGPLRWPTS